MYDLINLDDLWAEAHTLHFDAENYLYQIQNDWFCSLKNSPNGSLLTNNSFFNAMRSEENKIYILHVTKDIKEINRTSVLYPSAGCLVGCVYGTQLYKRNDGRFLMHNLGRHILTKEANLTNNNPTPLIIELSFSQSANKPILSGINYLKLGYIHHVIYKQLRYLLSPQERNDLEMRVSERIKNSLYFIDMCCQADRNRQYMGGEKFITILNRVIPNLAILGYIYFEAIAEYTMFYSEDTIGRKLKDRGEFNNMIYKDFLLDIYRQIGHFKLSDFNPTVKYIQNKIQNLNLNKKAKISSDEMLNYIERRVCNMVVNYLLNDSQSKPKWLSVSWDYDGLVTILEPLVGHSIHRELRNFNRYNDFYFYFDQFKALSVWNYWNKMHIALPFNGPIQKGEIGINPAYQDVTYKVSIGKIDKTSKDHLVVIENRPDIEISPRLVNLRHTSMRSRDYCNINLGALYDRS